MYLPTDINYSNFFSFFVVVEGIICILHYFVHIFSERDFWRLQSWRFAWCAINRSALTWCWRTAALNRCAPSYLSSLISRRVVDGRGGRVLGSSVAPSALYDLFLPSIHVKSYGNRAFSNYAPTVWNKLPVSVRSASSLPRFRTTLKTHFFCIAYKWWFPCFSREPKGAFDHLCLCKSAPHRNAIYYYYYYYQLLIGLSVTLPIRSIM